MDHAPFRAPLDHAAADLVHRLGGFWQSGGAMCRCPAHDDRIASLSVRVGRTSLLLKCFAGCATLDVLRAIRQLRGVVPVLARTQEVTGTTPTRAADFAAAAGRLWHDALPLAHSPAARYLAARGITRLSPALRFHARTPLGGGRAVTYRSAMLAAVTQDRRLLAVQRLFLDRVGDRLATDLPEPRRTLGRPRAGAVVLAKAGPVLGLAEGIETALSASMLLGIPVWAALGNERLAHIALPDVVRRLILLPDHDRAGRIGADRGRVAYAGRGIAVETWWPWDGLNDWNDVLRAGEEGWGIGRGKRSDGQAGREGEPPCPTPFSTWPRPSAPNRRPMCASAAIPPPMPSSRPISRPRASSRI